MVFNKNNKKEINAIEELIEAKIYVTPSRFEELSKLKDDIWNRPFGAPAEPCTLLCFNLSPAVECQLRGLEGYTLQLEHMSEDPTDPARKEHRKRFLKLWAAKHLQEARVAAVVHQLGGTDEQLTLLDRRVVALSLLNKLPVLLLATRGPRPLAAAAAATGATWPVFLVQGLDKEEEEEDREGKKGKAKEGEKGEEGADRGKKEVEGGMRPVLQWLAQELPRVCALSAALTADLAARVEPLGRLNAPLHFLKRASVALVPFGVMTVNFLGILRLMARILQLVGMRGDSSANRALGLLGAQNAALVTAVDSMGDVYSFAVFSTLLADLQGLGLLEAAAALDLLDGLALGSISAVTGAVSALGAYLSRPGLVAAAAQFLASLQVVHVLNPGMRRAGERRPPRGGGGGKGKGGKGKGRKGRKKGRKGWAEQEEEERRPLLERGAGTGLRWSGDGGQSAAADSAAAGEDGDGVVKEAGEGGASSSPDEMSDEGGSTDTREEGEKEEEGEGDSDGEAEAGAGVGANAAGAAIGATGKLESRTGRELVALSRAEKKQQALERRQAMRESRAAKAAAKAAAKVAKKAAKAEEREQERQAKQLQREQKAAAKAAAGAAKADGKSACQLVASDKAEAAVEAVGAAAGASTAPTKAPWWRRRKAAADGAPAAATADTEATGATPSIGGQAAARGGADGAGSWTSPRGSGIGDGAGGSEIGAEEGEEAEEEEEEDDDDEEEEEEVRERVQAALAREARLGLDEQTCRGLLDFLSLPDEEVYDEEAAAAAAEAAKDAAVPADGQATQHVADGRGQI